MSRRKPKGRPSSFTQTMADLICEHLAEGKSLRSICAVEGMPAQATVYSWLASIDAFRDQYARARNAQADTLFDEILDIADTPVIGEKTKTTEDGVEVTTGDMIEHRKLQVDARKWIAGKLRPKVYGDKSHMEVTGKDGGPIEHAVSAKDLTDEQLMAIINDGSAILKDKERPDGL